MKQEKKRRRRRRRRKGRRKEGKVNEVRINDIQNLIIRSFGFSVGHIKFQKKLPISTTAPVMRPQISYFYLGV